MLTPEITPPSNFHQHRDTTCVTDPTAIAALIRKRAPAVKRVVFETGPPSVWIYHALNAKGLPAICIDARHAKAALDMAPNKTDAKDADGPAHLAEVGFFREIRAKGFESMLTRTLVGASNQLVGMTTQLLNQIRGVMKTFGLLVADCIHEHATRIWLHVHEPET